VIHVPGDSLKKSLQPDAPVSSLEAPAAKIEVTYVPVYTFVIYDHDKGTTVVYPKMATRQTIANMRGKVNEETALVVDEALLESGGFYSLG
jgi:hypothetical protein